MNSLSGKYFNLVLGFFPGLIKEPLIIRIGNGTGVINKQLGFDIKGNLQLLRVIIESVEGTNIVSRHSNLLIINNQLKTISRFEPINGHKDFNLVNKVLVDNLRPSFKGYDYNFVNTKITSFKH